MLSARYYLTHYPNLMAKVATELKEVPQVDGEAAQMEQPQPQKPPRMPQHPLITAGKTLGAFTLGTAAGYGGLLGGNEIYRAVTGKPAFTKMTPLLHAIPALTGIGSAAFGYAQQALFDRMLADEAKRRELREQQEP